MDMWMVSHLLCPRLQQKDFANLGNDTMFGVKTKGLERVLYAFHQYNPQTLFVVSKIWIELAR